MFCWILTIINVLKTSICSDFQMKTIFPFKLLSIYFYYRFWWLWCLLIYNKYWHVDCLLINNAMEKYIFLYSGKYSFQHHNIDHTCTYERDKMSTKYDIISTHGLSISHFNFCSVAKLYHRFLWWSLESHNCCKVFCIISQYW